jgi:hypothetical protein
VHQHIYSYRGTYHGDCSAARVPVPLHRRLIAWCRGIGRHLPSAEMIESGMTKKSCGPAFGQNTHHTKHVYAGVSVTTYGDDITPASTHHKIKTTETQIHPYLDNMYDWTARNQLKLNPDKSSELYSHLAHQRTKPSCHS